MSQPIGSRVIGNLSLESFVPDAISRIPDDIKALYRTVWEIPQKSVIDMAADRGAFICQSTSLNIHIAEPNYAKLTSMHFYGWKKGLKTGMYYLRTKPAVNAIQFTVDKLALREKNPAGRRESVDSPLTRIKKKVEQRGPEKENMAAIACSLTEPESCEMCSG